MREGAPHEERAKEANQRARQKGWGDTYQTETEHEQQPGTEQTNAEYGARRSNLDRSLKVATLGHCFSSRGREFHILGAMFLIDLVSECSTSF